MAKSRGQEESGVNSTHHIGRTSFYLGKEINLFSKSSNYAVLFFLSYLHSIKTAVCNKVLQTLGKNFHL